MKSAVLSRKFHSRTAALVMILIAAAYTTLSDYEATAPDMGEPWLLSRLFEGIGSSWTVVINLIFNAVIIVLMALINRRYNVLRAMTWLPAGLFALMQAAIPSLMLTMDSGAIVCMTVTGCLMMLFGSYGNQESVYRVFLTFALLALGTAFRYCLVFFIPVLWIICIQMRVMNLRVFLSSLMGLLTTWIILLGFGIVDIESLRLPQMTSIFAALNLSHAYYLLTVVGATSALLVLSVLANIMKTIAYNARARAYNGALLITSLATLLCMLFDYDKLSSYLPLLNLCAAYQTTHYFVNHRYERQYIAILAVAMTYITLYLWRLSL